MTKSEAARAKAAEVCDKRTRESEEQRRAGLKATTEEATAVFNQILLIVDKEASDGNFSVTIPASRTALPNLSPFAYSFCLERLRTEGFTITLRWDGGGSVIMSRNPAYFKVELSKEACEKVLRENGKSVKEIQISW